jgi:hypothetical protein
VFLWTIIDRKKTYMSGQINIFYVCPQEQFLVMSFRGRRGHDRMAVGFITICASSA